MKNRKKWHSRNNETLNIRAIFLNFSPYRTSTLKFHFNVRFNFELPNSNVGHLIWCGYMQNNRTQNWQNKQETLPNHDQMFWFEEEVQHLDQPFGKKESLNVRKSIMSANVINIFFKCFCSLSILRSECCLLHWNIFGF